VLASLPSEQLLQRWAWLDRALDEMVGQLPPALRGDFAIPTGRPRVVTCGNTQVGKTTLVLSLLGCRPEAMPDLEVILRAGRTPGQSATAGPLHYVWVDGPDWRVGAGGELSGQVPDKDVASALSAARQRVGQGIALEPMTIGLPAKYRAEDRAYAASVTDLPGLQTRSAQEGAAAVRLLGYFAPRADVVILALRADDLGCLQQGRQLRDLVSAHMLPARRFRLVLTHAAQLAPRTAAPWKRGESGLVDNYREQFATFDYQHDAAMQAVLANQLYLFDLGSNRPTTPSAVPALAAVDDSTKALLRSLDAAAVSSTRRLTSAESVTIVSRFHERQEQQAKDQLADAEAALEAAQKELQEVLDAAIAARGEYEHAQAMQTQLLAARVPRVQSNLVIARDGGSVKQVRRAREQTGESLVQASERAWQAWLDMLPTKHQPRLTWKTIAAKIEQSFDYPSDESLHCCKGCDSSWLAVFAAHPNKCAKRTKQVLAEARASANVLLGTTARDHLAKPLDAAQTTCRRLAGELADLEARGTILVNRIAVREQDVVAASEKLARVGQVAEEAAARAARLDATALQEVRRTRHALLSQLADSTSETQRLLALTAMRDHCDFSSLHSQVRQQGDPA